MEPSLGDPGAPAVSIGDRVRLTRAVGSVPRGSDGKVLGLLRRDVDLLLVSFPAAGVLQLHPEDVVSRPDGAGRLT